MNVFPRISKCFGASARYFDVNAKSFRECSHGDLTTKVLYCKIFAYFVLYIIPYSVFCYQPSEAVNFCYKSNFLLKHDFYDLCNFQGCAIGYQKFLL